MAANTKIFSLEGKGLKLDTAADVDAHIKPLRGMEDVEEVRFLGNTLGVEACKVLGEVLETKKSLQVSQTLSRLHFPYTANYTDFYLDCQPSRYIYRPSPERNPPSALLSSHRAAHASQAPHHKPKR
jgi:hypothetical protein